MTYTRISTVKELCELDPSAIDFALSDQVERLSDLLVEAEKGAEEFFARNFVTQGMERLLREGLQRLKLLLTASLSESVDSIKGLSKSTLIEYLIVPDRSVTEFDDAFEELQKECWYLHKKDNDVWYFSKIENLRKRIQSRADSAPIGKIEEEMARRLSKVPEVAAGHHR